MRTILDIANRFPPFMCRYLARKKNGRAPMSLRDLSKATGLSRSKISTLSKLRSWKGVPIDVVVSFSEACGVHLNFPKRAREYIRKGKHLHVINGTAHQKRFFALIFKRESQRNATTPAESRIG